MDRFLDPNRTEVGCDEAGRGCLAGPVVAAAVILPPDFDIIELNDSKKLTASKRESLRPRIEEQAIAWAVGVCSPSEIDEINILKASFLAMHKALDQIDHPFDHILVDGNRFTAFRNFDHTCVIKGDGKYASIAAASILAKTHRDEIMKKLAREHPQFGWERNMGYPTRDHRSAIANHGPTPHHRMSFTLLPPQLKLDL
ncbi:MAG: ribonuclease HII [Bacteroidota bacterium]|nr:ribonuclease HII [Bacteroidota bacterium]